jgi:hypothetical protein
LLFAGLAIANLFFCHVEINNYHMLFNTPEEISALMDENVRCWDTHALIELRDSLRSASGSPEVIGLAALEALALGYWFEQGETRPELSATRTNGEETHTPLVFELLPAAAEYFQQRFIQIANPFLKARYALLLWGLPKPNAYGRYGQEALHALLACLPLTDFASEEGSQIYEVQTLLKTLVDLALKLNQKREEVTTAVLDRLVGTEPAGWTVRARLCQMVAEYSRLFKPTTLDPAILQSYVAIYNWHFTEQEFDDCAALSRYGRTVSQRLGLEVQSWSSNLGCAYEAQAREQLAIEDHSTVAINFYRLAAEAYRAAGDSSAVEQALVRIQELKPKLRLTTIRTKLPDEHVRAFSDHLNATSEYILAYHSSAIWYWMATDVELIPDLTQVRQEAEQNKSSLSSLFPIVYIDENRNIRPAAADPDALPHEATRLYQLGVGLRQHVIIRLLEEGYGLGKLTFESLKNYLDQQSWIAQVDEDTDFDGAPMPYTWQPMLYPGLREFFCQFDIMLRGDEEPNYVMCIDTLAVKVEGLLRDLLQRTNTPTVATGTHQDLREVYIEALLETEGAKQLFDENTRYFFRFVLLKECKNLRNDVAHGYYHHLHQYSFEKMVLLLCVLLRITALRFTSAEDAEG